MIAPALAPATSSHFVIGFVGGSANPQSAPASARPLTPPPRKTPSASVDRKSTRLNSSHSQISYAVFCLKKKKENITEYLLHDFLQLQIVCADLVCSNHITYLHEQ